MTPNRRSPGTISRKSATRLPATSRFWFERPVTLPPGRARLVTKPLPTVSPDPTKTIGIFDVACIAAAVEGVAVVKMTSTLSRTKLGCEIGKSLATSLRPTEFEGDAAALGPAQPLQLLLKCLDADLSQRIVGETHQHSDPFYLCRLLRPRHERPRCCCAAGKRDESAPLHLPPHSITLSARPSNVG